MARIRNIKPDFFRHELLNELEDKNPELRVMCVYSGLWTQCDKDGVFPYRPKLLKLDIMPFVDYEIEKTMDLLVENGFINVFTDSEKKWGYIPAFRSHQRISGEEAKQPARYPKYVGEKQEGSRKEAGWDTPPALDLGLRSRDIGEGSREPENNLVLKSWYKKHQEATARMVMPSDADRLSAKDLGNRYPQEELERAVSEYWAHWKDYWFSVKNGDSKKPREERKPMFVFSSFASHIEELLQGDVPRETPVATLPEKKLVKCPICGTMGDPGGRSQCKVCHFMLLPEIMADTEQVKSFKEEWDAEHNS